MKKVLIATTNKDKYSAVKSIFEATIFDKNNFIINSLADIDKKIIERKEEGDNVNRARAKALDAYEQLKQYNFDYIVGLDDAIRIRGKLEPNIKLFLSKILYEDFLEDGEEYSFNRAYCIISKNGTIYETTSEIPYYYMSDKNAIIEEFSYPLSVVAYPIGYTVPICNLSKEEELQYYLKYVKNKIIELKIK